MKKLIFLVMFLAIFGSACFGTITNTTSAIDWGSQSTYSKLPSNALKAWVDEVGGIIDANAGASEPNKSLVLNSSGQLTSLYLSGGLKILESGSSPTKFTYFSGGDQSADVNYVLPTGDAAVSGYVLSSNGAGVLSWIANAGTFAGGSITGDIVMANGIYLQSSETTAEASAIQVWDTTAVASYTNVLSWTNGGVPDIVLGAATNTLAIVSTGLNVTTAGVITGAGGITNTGILTTSGGAVNVNANSNYATNINTGSSSGTVTIGGGLGSLVINTANYDVTADGALSGITGVTMTNGSAIKSSTTTAETIAIQGYDTSGAGAYENSILITNGDVPAVKIGSGTDTVAIDSADWDISPEGVMTGIGAITSDGLFTGSLGATITGAIVNLNASSNFATNINTGTSTGTVSIGSSTSGAITVDTTSTIGVNSDAAQTYTVTDTIAGNAYEVNTTDGGISLNAGGGTNGNVTIAGANDITITAADDLTLNGGSAGSLINIGTNTHGNQIHVGDNDTTADTITIGSAKDTSSLAGISVTVGSTGTTSATVVQSGTGNLNLTTPKLMINGTATQLIEIEGTANAFEDVISFTDPAVDANYIFPTFAAEGSFAVVTSTLTTNAPDVANSVTGGTNQLIFEGATADAYETVLTPVDPCSDATLSLPDSTGGIPVVIRQGATDVNAANATVVVPDSNVVLPSGWFYAGKTLKWTIAGTITGDNDRFSVILDVNGTDLCTITTTDAAGAQGDFVATFTMYEHTDTAHQAIVGELHAAGDVDADATAISYVATTGNMAGGDNVPAVVEIKTENASDNAVCSYVRVDYWVK